MTTGGRRLPRACAIVSRQTRLPSRHAPVVVPNAGRWRRDPASAEHHLPRGVRLADRFLCGQRLPARGARPAGVVGRAHHLVAEPRVPRPDAGPRRRRAADSGRAPGPRTDATRQSRRDAVGARRPRRHRRVGGRGVCAARAAAREGSRFRRHAPVRLCVYGGCCRARPPAADRLAVVRGTPQSRGRNRQPALDAPLDEGGRRQARTRRSSPRRRRPTSAASSRRTSSWIRRQCGECHKDIYEQWKSSAHHFASFNNQFYRKSIEYMQEVVGTQPSKWCAGCHDHAVFFNGRFEKPIKEQIDTPEAQAGLACTSCHAITHVDSSMGNGGFTIEYPPLHELATQQEPVHPRDRQLPDLSEPGAAPEDVHEAVHAAGLGGVLLVLPQGAPRRAGERLPLVPRLQRLRQLAGERRLRPGRALVLLPAEGRRPAPTATCRWSTRRTRATRGRQGPLAPLPGGEHGGRRSSTRTRRRWRPPRSS